MKKIILLLIFLASHYAQAQPLRGFDRDSYPNYVFLTSGNIVADKNFYLATVIEHSPEIKKNHGSR